MIFGVDTAESQNDLQVVSTVRNSPRLKNIFQSFSQLELLTYPETRFAYALLMLERFVRVKRALIDTVQVGTWEIYKAKQYVAVLLFVPVYLWRLIAMLSSLLVF